MSEDDFLDTTLKEIMTILDFIKIVTSALQKTVNTLRREATDRKKIFAKESLIINWYPTYAKIQISEQRKLPSNNPIRHMQKQ